VGVDKICEILSGHPPSKFQFLIDIAELVYFARRALSWMYVKRYYLEDKSKKELMDFRLNDMCRYLERLNEKNEERWEEAYIEDDAMGSPVLTMGFASYKEQVIGLKSCLEKSFLGMMK
jgi:hypothetical protein